MKFNLSSKFRRIISLGSESRWVRRPGQTTEWFKVFLLPVCDPQAPPMSTYGDSPAGSFCCNSKAVNQPSRPTPYLQSWTHLQLRYTYAFPVKGCLIICLWFLGQWPQTYHLLGNPVGLAKPTYFFLLPKRYWLQMYANNTDSCLKYCLFSFVLLSYLNMRVF